MTKNIKPQSVTPSFAAACLGVTGRHLQRLAKDGVVIKAGRGRYDLPVSVKNYYARKETTYDEARLKNIELDNEAKEFELATKYGQVHSVAEYSIALEQALSGVAKILESLPDAVVRACPNLPQEALDAVAKSGRDCQNRIADLLENEGKEPEEHS